MAKIYYQEDCDLSLLQDKTIAVIGYGSQGHAHALNLKESGCNVIVGLYKGSKSWAKAEAQGLTVYTAAEAAKKADIIMIDLHQPNMQPLNNIQKNIVYSGSKQNVKMTMIDGQILYYDGKFLCCDDVEGLYAKANEIINRLSAQ